MTLREKLRSGLVIPAHPLALNSQRKLDERRQRALTRYYLSAGSGGIAVGVHTTQFAIREVGLLRPVLELAAEEEKNHKPITLKIAGICGPTRQAVAEATLARDLGYDIRLLDLLTEFRFGATRLRIVGGLLGHWSVWTRKAVELLAEVHRAGGPTPELLTRAVQITDSNAAFFDTANAFHGCIAGLHEVLRRQGLLEGLWCLDPKEGLSPSQKEEIDRVYTAYPQLHDDAFVEQYRDLWLR